MNSSRLPRDGYIRETGTLRPRRESHPETLPRGRTGQSHRSGGIERGLELRDLGESQGIVSAEHLGLRALFENIDHEHDVVGGKLDEPELSGVPVELDGSLGDIPFEDAVQDGMDTLEEHFLLR